MATPSRTRRRVLMGLCLWIGFWVFLFIVTHRPMSPRFELRLPHLDKVVHFALYFVLTLLGGSYLRMTGRQLNLRTLSAWACVYAAYGGVDEWLQQFVRRDPSWADWLADAAGIGVATLALLMYTRVQQND